MNPLAYLKLGLFVACMAFLAWVYWLYNSRENLILQNEQYKIAQAETLATMEKIKQQRDNDIKALDNVIEAKKKALANMKAINEQLKGLQDAQTAEVLKKTVLLLNQKNKVKNEKN